MNPEKDELRNFERGRSQSNHLKLKNYGLSGDFKRRVRCFGSAAYKVICIGASAIAFYLLYAVFRAPVISSHARLLQVMEVGVLLFSEIFFWTEIILQKPLFFMLGNRMRITAGTTAVIFLFLSLFLEILILTGTNTPADKCEPEAILVLGCGLKQDGSPTNTLRLRLKKASEIARKYPSLPVILSGGKGGDELLAEAQVMANWLVHNGISANRMHLESNSSTTRENFRFSRALIQWKTPDHPCVLLVTTDFHMFRSCWTGHDQGYLCIPCPADPCENMWIINHPREQLGIIKHFILHLGGTAKSPDAGF